VAPVGTHVAAPGAVQPDVAARDVLRRVYSITA
jgi:hypothetical protein